MSATIIDGNRIAAGIRTDLKTEIDNLKITGGIVPGLAVVLVGEDPASRVYVRMKNRACSDIGIYSEQHTFGRDITEAALLEKISELNSDNRIHGILVQLPLPPHIEEQKVIGAILPEKDVDGFHPVNMGKLLIGIDGFKPCTPYGVQQMLVHAGIPVEGAHVVVVGRSNIVGKPIAGILVQKQKHANATVTLCHSRTKNLAGLTRQADILIAAIGKPEAITADMVKEDAVVIDVGVNRVDDPGSEKGYKLVGDVKFGEVSQKCRAISPVPGGVGPMTITMLLYNTVQSAKNHAGIE
ncbi:MAG: bifunctional methylenetetrahydrofolate dehydrogenase/methenyltetrahydrofolate cyclohydrolase FolD [Spirochaetales bacterium]|nr:bifunctional methylenetetrahydrofolate dehydrogenase/methenyltetrahydrofolate cyclohydrolase FolD [Spirochaetales bacterium]